MGCLSAAPRDVWRFMLRTLISDYLCWILSWRPVAGGRRPAGSTPGTGWPCWGRRPCSWRRSCWIFFFFTVVAHCVNCCLYTYYVCESFWGLFQQQQQSNLLLRDSARTTSSSSGPPFPALFTSPWNHPARGRDPLPVGLSSPSYTLRMPREDDDDDEKS